MTRVRVVALTLLVLAALSQAVALTPGRAAAGTYGPRSAEIDGVRLVVRQTDGPLAAVCVFVAAGSAGESRENNGITCLLNNLVVSSNPTAGSSAVLDIEAFGGTVEAETAPEYSCFKLTVPRKNLDAALAALGRAISRPPLDESSLRVVRRRLIAMSGRRLDAPVEKGYAFLLSKSMDESPYALSPEGRPESLKGISLSELSRWHADNFVRGNVLVSVCADIDIDGFRKMARNAFSGLPDWPRADRKSGAQSSDAGCKAGSSFELGTSSSASVALVGYAAPPLGSPDYAAAMLVDAVVADGMGSRLFRSLRVDGKLAYSYGSILPAMTSCNRLTFYVGTDAASIDAAARCITSSVEDLAGGGLSDTELDRARGQALGQISLEDDGQLESARRAGLAAVLGMGPGYWDELASRLAKTDARDVVRAARKYMNSYTLVVLRPDEGGR